MASRPGTTKARQGAARRPRGSLNREEIVHGAFELAEAEGVEGLSMLRLARHLGVGVTSIYWYVRSKEELLEELAEEAAVRLYGMLPGYRAYAWDERLLRYFVDFRQVFRAHPVLCDLLVRRTPMQALSPAARRRFSPLLEREIGALVEAGFTVPDAVSGYATLAVYTRGCILNERLFDDAEKRDRDTGRDAEAEADFAGLAAMAAAAEYWSPGSAAEEKFAAGIGFIIDGMRARLAATAAAGAVGSGPAPPATGDGMTTESPQAGEEPAAADL